ncbi:P-loop containing nucleoside triphosphate hydrolase protein, partial [Baffinella frigidus]
MKRFHLDNPGRVLAAIHVEGVGECGLRAPGAAEPCEVVFQVGLNATTLVEVRGDLSPLADMDVGLLSLQSMLHQAVRFATFAPAAGGSTAHAGEARVTTRPTSGSRSFGIEDASSKVSLVTSLYFVAAWIPSVQILMTNIVTERKLRLRDIMRCAGVRDLVFWMAWLLSELVCLAGAIVLVVGLGSFATLFQGSDLSLAFLVFLSFAGSIITLSFFLSTFFDSPKVAGAVGSGLLALFSFVFTLMRLVGLPDEVFWAAALLSPVAMSSAAVSLWNGSVTWASLASPPPPGQHSVAALMLIMNFDTILYFVLALFLDKAFATEGKFDFCFWLPAYARRRWRGTGGGEADWVPLLNMGGEEGGARGGRGGGEVAGLAHGDEGDEGGEGGDGLVFRGLRKVFDCSGVTTVAVDGVSLDVPAGQLLCLLGPNGAGKSTVLGLLTGMLAPSSGAARVFGRWTDDPDQLADLREDLGLCPQEDVLLEELTVREHLQFFAGIKRLSRADVEKEVEDRSKELALEDMLDKQVRTLSGGYRRRLSVALALVRTLSGGYRRRLSVALALVGQPRLVVLDEPSAGMDANARRLLWEALSRAKEGRVIVLSTHSMDEADAISDRIGIMVHGALRAEGSPLELKAKYGLGYRLQISRTRLEPFSSGKKERPAGPPQDQALGPPQDEEGDGPASGSEWGLHSVPKAVMGVGGGGREAADAILKLAVEHVPGARLREVALDLGETEARSLAGLLRALDHPEQRAALGVAGYGLTSSSLEEVFARICEDAAVDPDSDRSLPQKSSDRATVHDADHE